MTRLDHAACLPLCTPIHIAVCHGKIPTMELLLSRGAETLGAVQLGLGSILHTVARTNNTAAAHFLFKDTLANVDALDEYGFTPLHLAW